MKESGRALTKPPKLIVSPDWFVHEAGLDRT